MALDLKQLLKPVKDLRGLIGRIDGDPRPEDVHRLRTNIRRTEAAFEALSLGKGGAARPLLKDLGRLRGRAGRVRDMDVLTGFACAVHPAGEDDCGVRLLEHLGAKRERRAEKLFTKAKALRRRVRKNLKGAAAEIRTLLQKGGDRKRKNASTGAAANALALAADLGTPRRLDRKNLHLYRLKVKKLLYVLRMGNAPAHAAFTENLDQVKDAIGEWHDREQLVAIAHKVLVHGKACKLEVELKRQAAAKYRRALKLAQDLRKNHIGAAALPRPRAVETISRLAG